MLRMGRTKADPTKHENEREDSMSTSSRLSLDSYQSAETQFHTPQETPSSTRALTESETLARNLKDGTLTGYVGNGTVLAGEIGFRGMLRCDGQIKGRVTSEDGTLIIGNGGAVDADIEVAIAIVNGTLNGDVLAKKRLEMGRAARVSGNIQTQSLVVEQGAIFEGSCKMSQLRADAEKERETQAALSDEIDEESESSVIDDSDFGSVAFAG